MKLPGRYNYVGCFLTLDCNYSCGYCLNSISGIKRRRRNMSGREWAEAINRLQLKSDLPVTLQGGEPSLHPDFTWIINNIREDINIDILTNLSFDEKAFVREVDPGRLRRSAPYASIRVTYHPGSADLNELIKKTGILCEAGFSIGIYAIDHPDFQDENIMAEKAFNEMGVDFRWKEYLGWYGGILMGNYAHGGAAGKMETRECFCRTSELLLDPAGNIFRCHYYLYMDTDPLGSILDREFSLSDEFRKCVNFGRCNPCDVKIKNNRFQEFGHTSVEIEFPET